MMLVGKDWERMTTYTLLLERICERVCNFTLVLKCMEISSLLVEVALTYT